MKRKNEIIPYVLAASFVILVLGVVGWTWLIRDIAKYDYHYAYDVLGETGEQFGEDYYLAESCDFSHKPACDYLKLLWSARQACAAGVEKGCDENDEDFRSKIELAVRYRAECEGGDKGACGHPKGHARMYEKIEADRQRVCRKGASLACDGLTAAAGLLSEDLRAMGVKPSV